MLNILKTLILIILISTFSHYSYAELKGADVKKVQKHIKDKETADFIIKHAKRVNFSGKNLYMLDLSGQELNALPKNLAKISSIKELKLKKNNFDEFPQEILSLSNLEKLDLESNNIQSIPELIKRLLKLEELVLRDNNITQFPASVIQLKKLERLNLSKNKLTALPDFKGGLNSLEYLSLSYNKFKELPKTVSSLSNLESLSLSGNDINNIPNEISSLSNLETLEITDNKLKSLPSGICKLGNLESLKLSDNKIDSLPNCIGSLNSLRTFSLYNNRLSVLPDSIVQLNKAFMLNLSNNQLKTLPNSMGDLVNMQHLNLEGNPIKSLPLSLSRLDKIESIGVTFGDKSKKFERRKGESVKKFFERCYQFKWRDDSLVAKSKVNARDVVNDDKKSKDPVYQTGRELGKAIVSEVMGEEKKENDKSTPVENNIKNLSNKSKHLVVETPTPKAGVAFKVDYVDMPGSQGDWIAFVKADLPDDTYGDYFYPYGKKSGSHSFNGVPEGDYEIRVYYDWPSGGYVVQDRLKIKVIK